MKVSIEKKMWTGFRSVLILLPEAVTVASKEIQLLAQQTADGANDTSAATEEQLAANQEISSSAQSLANLAEILQNEVSHFKIN